MTPDTRFLDLAQKGYVLRPADAWDIWPKHSAGVSQYLVRPETAHSDAFWLEVSHMSMNDEDNQYLIRLRDVTHTMTVRSNLWTSHAMIAHKLRTPLTLMSTTLELLSEIEGETNMDSSQGDMLRTASRRANQIRDQILRLINYVESPEVAKPGSSNSTLALVAELISIIQSELHLGTVRSSYHDIDNLSDVELRISSKAVELIFWELLENAKKFHPEQNPEVDIWITQQEGSIQIEVRDNGINLSPQQLTQIWYPYYQAERGFSGQIPGMGLGLSTVASLIWRVGGTCEARNRPNQAGVTIVITLPLA